MSAKNSTATEVKERPILFSTPMVKAILEGRKTVTRRLTGIDPRVNKDPDNWMPVGCDPVYPGDRLEESDINSYCDFQTKDTVWMALNKFAGQEGDILWVRETWGLVPTGKGQTIGYKATHEGEMWNKWKPSIHMPKDICRIRLQIQSIGVERLHDIRNADAIKEGIEELLQSRAQLGANGRLFRDYSKKPEMFNDGLYPRESFRTLWTKINGRESWDANPWVWRIQFSKL